MTSSLRTLRLVAALATLASVAVALEPSDWNQWRGPERSGDASRFGLLESWPERTTTVWEVEVGEGQASPLVAGDRVVLFDRVGANERVLAVRLEDGSTLWQVEDPVEFKPGMGGGHYGAGPKATPVIEGDYLVTYGVASLLTVRRLEDGRMVWRRDLTQEAPDPTLYWGNSMSPIVVDGQVVVQYGNDRNGGVRAYDLESGESRWSVDGYGSSYSSPILVGEGEERHLALMTWEGPLGLSFDGRVLWQLPLPMSFSRQNTATPLYSNGIFVYTGESRPLHAVRLERRGDDWSATPLWQRDDLPHDLASPIAYDDRVCGFTTRNKGQLFCVDLETGEDLWRGPGRAGEFAVLLVTPEALLVTYADGRLVVLPRDAADFVPLAEYSLTDSEIWAHPAVVPGGLVVKDFDRLRRVGFVGR